MGCSRCDEGKFGNFSFLHMTYFAYVHMLYVNVGETDERDLFGKLKFLSDQRKNVRFKVGKKKTD